jgi:hypothetical protein
MDRNLWRGTQRHGRASRRCARHKSVSGSARQHGRTTTQLRGRPSCYAKFPRPPRNCSRLIAICMKAVTACMPLVKGLVRWRKTSRKEICSVWIFQVAFVACVCIRFRQNPFMGLQTGPHSVKSTKSENILHATILIVTVLLQGRPLFC